MISPRSDNQSEYVDVLPLLCSVSGNFMKNNIYTFPNSTMLSKFLINIYLLDSDSIVSDYLEKFLD